MSIVGLASCWMLAGLFALAAFAKARNHASRQAFRATVSRLTGLPNGLATAAAIIVMVIETGSSMLLLVRPTMRAGLLAAALLLSLFTIASVRAIGSGADVACNCFGATTGRLGQHTVIRNLALLAVVLAGWRFAADAQEPVVAGEGLLAAAGAAIGVVLVLAWDTLAELGNGRVQPARREDSNS